ncbi:MAG TPA: hypothetical protein VMS02_08685 [Solirubrobacteraceae bacterium]|nr:hypothetical protein [Solirubrobacteraceae bacterium]
MPATAAAASPPTIGNTWSYGVTQTDATLEAEINPQDPSAGVYYQFQVVADTSEFQPEILCPPEKDWRPLDGCIGESSPSALPIGFIEHGSESRAARVDLADAGVTLQPDTTYHYRVLAARRVATEDTIQWEGPAVVGGEQTFTTLATGPAPRIESESVLGISSTDATLEAQINPEGRATTYEFDLEAPSCLARGFGACEASGGLPIYRGTLPAGSTGKTVSVDVDGAWYGHNLLPNTLYGYRVIARSASGAGVGRNETFRTASGLAPAIPPDTGTPGGAQQTGTTQTTAGGDQTGTAGGGATQSSSPGPAGSGPVIATGKTGSATADLVPAARHGKTKHRHHHMKAARRPAKAGKHNHKRKR